MFVRPVCVILGVTWTPFLNVEQYQTKQKIIGFDLDDLTKTKEFIFLQNNSNKTVKKMKVSFQVFSH